MSLGDRLRQFLTPEDGEVLLVAPFVKAAVVAALLAAVPDAVPVRCVTRWRAEEVLTGVSDLEVADVVAARPGTRLLLLPDLHAKLYIRGDRCLVGSANLTQTALGWSSRSNAELLVEVDRSDPDVMVFEDVLREAVPADESRRADVAAAVEALKAAGWTPPLRDSTSHAGGDLYEIPPWGGDAERPADNAANGWTAAGGGPGGSGLLLTGLRLGAWLPLCKAPHQLFDVYEERTAALTMNALRDARADLAVLSIPAGLNAGGFVVFARSLLSQHPVVQTITEAMTRGPVHGQDIVAELAPYTGATAPYLKPREAYEVLRSWLLYFFQDRYMVEKRFEGEVWSLGSVVAVWGSR